MTAFAAKHVTVRAGAATLLEDVSIDIAPGRLTMLMGPNGAGKSTLLSVMTGDRTPHAGSVSLNGKPLPMLTLQEQAKRRAVLTQSLALDFPMTVFEVVKLGCLPWESSLREQARAVEASLEAAGAVHLAHRNCVTLSGGERQRVHIARCLAQIAHRSSFGEPVYLLLDEPTANLDLKYQVLTLEVCRKLTAEGVGVLCVLHDIALAKEYADDVLLLKGGRVFACGTPRACLTAGTISGAFDISLARSARLAASQDLTFP